MLNTTDAQRIKFIREERWMTYPRARFALEALEEPLEKPRTTRMASIAIYADSGMGKTMLMERLSG